jgi:hypothetical protein
MVMMAKSRVALGNQAQAFLAERTFSSAWCSAVMSKKFRTAPIDHVLGRAVGQEARQVSGRHAAHFAAPPGAGLEGAAGVVASSGSRACG